MADLTKRNSPHSASQKLKSDSGKELVPKNRIVEVNVHQFYPVLDHTFTKALENRPHGASKELVVRTATDDSVIPSSNTESLHSELTSDTFQTRSDTTLTKSDTTQQEDNSNNSADKPEDGSEAGLFATAVSEETIQAAKARSKSLFKPETWMPVKDYSPSLAQIVHGKAAEHFVSTVKHRESGNSHGALSSVNKAIILKQNETQYYEERGEIYLSRCDLQSAILNYKKACLMEPDNAFYITRLAFIYFYQGQILFDLRQYDEALESFSKASEMKPDNNGYHIRSIACLASLNRHGECLALVNKRLERDQTNADLFVLRARLHEMFRNTTLCYYDVKDALGLDPSHPEAVKMINKLEQTASECKLHATKLYMVGKHREAVQRISAAIETNPSVADYHVLRGALHRRLGDFNSAIDDFLLALDKCDHDEASPVYLDSQRQLLLTYNDFAVECFTKGFYDEAVVLLNKAIKGEKKERGLYINRGDCFFRQGELNFALQDYHQALEMGQTDNTVRTRISVIHNEFGVNAYQDKEFAEAENKFTLAIQYNPTLGQYYISRSRSRYMLENHQGARQDLLMGLHLDPANEDILSILSRLFPGKSVADVMTSRAADSAKLALQNLVATASPVKLQPIEKQSAAKVTSNQTVTTVAEHPSTESINVWVPDRGIPDIKSCMMEQEFNIRLVKDKQWIQNKVKSALTDRKSLKYNGPRLGPLPPPLDKPSSGRYVRKDNLVLQNNSSNWKQFSLGIGVKGGN